MLLAKCLDPARRYRLALSSAAGPIVLEVGVATSQHKRLTGTRTTHSMTDKGFLPNARLVEADDETGLLTFWQEGKGVAVELCGHVPYSAVLGIEPLD